MEMEASCCKMFGLIIMLLSSLAGVVSFLTPYWVTYTFNMLEIKGIAQYLVVNSPNSAVSNNGIWAHCWNKQCTWLFDNDFLLQNQLPDWFKAVQGLMSAGLGLGLIALLVTTLSLCCRCNPRHAISGLMLTSSVSMAVGLIVFGIKANGDWGIEISNNTIGEFGWSFYVGIGAAGLALITSFVYCCMSRRPDQYS